MKKQWGVRLPDGSWLGEKQIAGWSFLGHRLGTPCAYSNYHARRKAWLYGDGAKAELLPAAINEAFHLIGTRFTNVV